MSARSSAVGDGIGRLYWPMLLISRDLILLVSVSVVFMSMNSLVLRC